jgi:hypothetical protein
MVKSLESKELSNSSLQTQRFEQKHDQTVSVSPITLQSNKSSSQEDKPKMSQFEQRRPSRESSTDDGEVNNTFRHITNNILLHDESNINSTSYRNGGEIENAPKITETSCDVHEEVNSIGDGKANAIKPLSSARSARESSPESQSASPDSGAIVSQSDSFEESNNSSGSDNDDRDTEIREPQNPSQDMRLKLQVSHIPFDPKDTILPLESIVPLREAPSRVGNVHDDEVFSTQVNREKQAMISDDVSTLPVDSETIVLEGGGSSPQIMRLHQIYMRKLSTGSGGSIGLGNGKDNLAFIAEEEPDHEDMDNRVIACVGDKGDNNTSKFMDGGNECSNCYALPNVPRQGKALSLQDECILENLQRTTMRDMRKLLNSSESGLPDGIRVGTFIDVFSSKVRFTELTVYQFSCQAGEHQKNFAAQLNVGCCISKECGCGTKCVFLQKFGNVFSLPCSCKTDT